jgi:hypothetical protein
MFVVIKHTQRQKSILMRHNGTRLEKRSTNVNTDYRSHEKGKIRVHINSVHLKNMAYSCPACLFVASTSSTMRTHCKSVHLNIMGFKCNLCDMGFRSNAELQLHTQIVHEMKKDFKCGHCNYASPRKQELTTHIKAEHDKILDYTCHTCGMQRHNCQTYEHIPRHVIKIERT